MRIKEWMKQACVVLYHASYLLCFRVIPFKFLPPAIVPVTTKLSPIQQERLETTSFI